MHEAQEILEGFDKETNRCILDKAIKLNKVELS